MNSNKARTIRLTGKKNMGACLVIHGFAGLPGHVAPLCKALNERGFTVVAPLLPGHGETMKDIMKARPKDWVSEVREIAKGLKAIYGRVYVTGISAGGVMALMLAQEGIPDAIAPLGAPVFFYTPWTLFYKFIRSFFWRARRMAAAEDGEYAMPDAPKRDFKWLIREVFVMKNGLGKTWRAVGCFRMIMGCARKLSRVVCPLVIVHSRKDEMAKPESADLVLSRVSSHDKQVVWLNASSHLRMLFGSEKNKVFEAIGGLFERVDKELAEQTQHAARLGG